MAVMFAALLSVACGGGAAVRTTTVLLVPSGDAAESSEAERVLRRRITEREDLELTSLARLASLAADAEREDTDAVEMEAQHRMAEADEAFSNFDYAGATTQLAEALDLLRPLAARATGRQRLAALHLQLANVLQVHGERDAAIEHEQARRVARGGLRLERLLREVLRHRREVGGETVAFRGDAVDQAESRLA